MPLPSELRRLKNQSDASWITTKRETDSISLKSIKQQLKQKPTSELPISKHKYHSKYERTAEQMNIQVKKIDSKNHDIEIYHPMNDNRKEYASKANLSPKDKKHAKKLAKSKEKHMFQKHRHDDNNNSKRVRNKSRINNFKNYNDVASVISANMIEKQTLTTEDSTYNSHSRTRTSTGRNPMRNGNKVPKRRIINVDGDDTNINTSRKSKSNAKARPKSARGGDTIAVTNSTLFARGFQPLPGIAGMHRDFVNRKEDPQQIIAKIEENVDKFIGDTNKCLTFVRENTLSIDNTSGAFTNINKDNIKKLPNSIKFNQRELEMQHKLLTGEFDKLPDDQETRKQIALIESQLNSLDATTNQQNSQTDNNANSKQKPTSKKKHKSNKSKKKVKQKKVEKSSNHAKSKRNKLDKKDNDSSTGENETDEGAEPGFFSVMGAMFGLTSIKHAQQDLTESNLQQTFQIVDIDDSGVIDINEFTKAIAEMGYQDNIDAEKEFERVDIDNSGLLDFEEFRRAMLGKKAKKISVKMLAKIFRKLDEDNTNTLSFDEFTKAAKYIGFGKIGGQDDIQDCFMEVDTNNSGMVDWDEFVQAILMKKPSKPLDQYSDDGIELDEVDVDSNANAYGGRNDEQLANINQTNDPRIDTTNRDKKNDDKKSKNDQEKLFEKECKDMFDKYDADNSGYLEYKDFVAAGKLLGCNDSKKLKKAFIKLDVNDDGQIDCNEFVQLMIKMKQKRQVKKEKKKKQKKKKKDKDASSQDKTEEMGNLESDWFSWLTGN